MSSAVDKREAECVVRMGKTDEESVGTTSEGVGTTGPSGGEVVEEDSCWTPSVVGKEH